MAIEARVLARGARPRYKGPVPTVRVCGVTKAFGPLVAVKNAFAQFAPGEVHALIGENGAGKSSLLRMVAGLDVPDSGTIEVDGTPLAPATPLEAMRRGIAIVTQHFALVEPFTALENICLGVEPVMSFGRVDGRQARSRARKVADSAGLKLPLDVPVSAMGVGHRQRVEIVRALYRGAKTILLDEPTAVLSPIEVERLYSMLRRLAAGGYGIVVVTHHLKEVRRYADHVTVMRRGQVVESRPVRQEGPSQLEIRSLTAAAMGSEEALPALPPRTSTEGQPGAIALKVDGVGCGRALENVTFLLREGEIIGIAGVEGNGQQELVEVLSGLREPTTGKFSVEPPSRTVPPWQRIATVFADRQEDGLVLDASIGENITLGELKKWSPLGWLRRRLFDQEVRKRMADADLQASPDAPVRGLSGGNQQKVVVGRALEAVAAGARVLVLSHPTRGVDVRASRAIHHRVRQAALGGCGVLILSSDLNELRAVADRILVMARGRIVADLPPGSSDQIVGRAMLAGRRRKKEVSV